MRIIAGAWRGRRLIAPAGQSTRPTADRVRQALFDMLTHAPWGGREIIEGARVLDAFAGTGALGLEALSRGAAHATFIENDPAALRALRGNITACGAGARASVFAADVLSAGSGRSCGLVFLDPPYGGDLAIRAIQALAERGWIAPEALIVTETPARDVTARFIPACSRPAVDGTGASRAMAGAGPLSTASSMRREQARGLGLSLLAERTHGAARITVWRARL